MKSNSSVMEFVALQLPYYRRMGIAFYNTTDFRSKFFKMWPSFLIILTNFGLINSIYEYSKDITIFILLVSYSLNNIAVSVKFSTLILSHQRFIEVYDKMKDLYKTAHKEVKCNISRYDERNRKMLKCYYLAYLVAAGVHGSIPVVTSSSAWNRHFNNVESTQKILPYFIWYGIFFIVKRIL